MTPAPNDPSDLPHKPTHAATDTSHSRGLSLGATVGIAIGVALLVILSAAGAWIFVRRRRRKWGQKRKAQPDVEGSGDTPNEEIAKKVEAGNVSEMSAMPGLEKRDEGAVELDAGTVERVELGAGGDEEKKSGVGAQRKREVAGGVAPVEIGGGERVVAELEGEGVGGRTREVAVVGKANR